MKKYDYCNCYGNWRKATENELNGVNLKGLVEVYEEGKYLRCVYESGREIFYSNIYGTWGSPVEFV